MTHASPSSESDHASASSTEERLQRQLLRDQLIAAGLTPNPHRDGTFLDSEAAQAVRRHASVTRQRRILFRTMVVSLPLAALVLVSMAVGVLDENSLVGGVAFALIFTVGFISGVIFFALLFASRPGGIFYEDRRISEAARIAALFPEEHLHVKGRL